mmetsp:Transcript_21845/g.35355  ORF Transcript_21845/g.35355 Transcript_21845/m.35355 type:complete len:353 (+) Transcript_21845:131-1189(+)|eukprot:CAMPEP_0198684594 /NCGR_PEP_ID=MMETSP1468-20131203/12434_1 /TAXON_ID=1461545 /ORGANISM="Mantoniella sp, Strain CCMP1436" /LENGTH=352 /DNA_ID=CAMNT_0044429503 /DNA_START=116 /DNA_END=1174 /DNA_ORIENTATION=+
MVRNLKRKYAPSRVACMSVFLTIAVFLCCLKLVRQRNTSQRDFFETRSDWPALFQNMMDTNLQETVGLGMPSNQLSVISILRTSTVPSFLMLAKSAVTDEAVTATLLRQGSFEPAFLQNLISKLDKDSLFVDVGANIGFFGLYAASRGLTVTFVDVQCGNVQRIRGSILLNGWQKSGRVFVVRKAASSSTGAQMDILRGSRVNPGGWGVGNASHHPNLVHDNEAECLQVETVTLDDLIPNVEVALMKIDVEGHERFTLQGMERLLSTQRVNEIVLEFWAVTGVSWLIQFRKYGYEISVVQDSAHDYPGHFESFLGENLDVMASGGFRKLVSSIDCDHANHTVCCVDLYVRRA